MVIIIINVTYDVNVMSLLILLLMLCLNTFSDKIIILLQVTSSNLKLTSAIDDNSRLGDLELDRAVFAAAVVIELSHFR